MKTSTARLAFLLLMAFAPCWNMAAAQTSDLALLEKLKSSDVQTRRDAAKQIEADRSFPIPSHVAQIFVALDDSDAEVRAWVASALMDRTVLDPSFSQVIIQNRAAIIKRFSDPSDPVRELAVKIVYFIRPQPPSEFATPMIGLLSDPKRSVRQSALAVLVKIRPVDPKVRTAILSLLTADGGELKAYAARGLGEMGGADQATVDALAIALKDKNPFVQQEAIKALARIGHPAASAQDALAALLRDESVDGQVKKLAEQAMKAIQ